MVSVSRVSMVRLSQSFGQLTRQTTHTLSTSYQFFWLLMTHFPSRSVLVLCRTDVALTHQLCPFHSLIMSWSAVLATDIWRRRVALTLPVLQCTQFPFAFKSSWVRSPTRVQERQLAHYYTSRICSFNTHLMKRQWGGTPREDAGTNGSFALCIKSASLVTCPHSTCNWHSTCRWLF